jgi:hypothetical protein
MTLETSLEADLGKFLIIECSYLIRESNFSFDSFGSTSAAPATPPPVPVKPQNNQPSFDNSFDFPSNLAEYDTGKDSFG